MPTVEAIVSKMKTRPADIRFEEAERVLEHYWYKLLRTKGSHSQFGNSVGELPTIPRHSRIKAVYVKEILKRIGEKDE